MREWIEEISDYMEEREKLETAFLDLTEEIHQRALETQMLIDASHDLQLAITAIAGKVEHANS